MQPYPHARAPPDGSRPRRRLGRPRLLIIGCGDTGLRIVARLAGRFRIIGTVAREASMAAVRVAGAVPMQLDLDAPARSQRRSLALAARVLVLAPPTSTGLSDSRSIRLTSLLRRPRAHAAGRMVYVSTTGVYGDRGGAWTWETTPARPATDRARRRLAAEQRLRSAAWRAAVLRVPGIYGPGRMPLERLRSGLPVPAEPHDPYTNHIHVEDLARACIAALWRAAPGRLYNAIDDTELRLGGYLDRVAGHFGLATPPRAPLEAVRAAAGPLRMSFMEESRRVGNARMKRELRLRLRYPDIDAGLAALACDQASNSPSTER